MELTAQNVENVLMDCLYPSGSNEEEILKEAKIVDGIMNKWGFRPEKLEEHKEDIYSMLLQLPHGFRKGSGGGWSFLEACYREDGTQWTGLHRTMDMLFSLGQAIGKVKLLMPREYWKILPGGMPYYQIDVD